MDFKQELVEFQNHLAVSTNEILDVIDTSDKIDEKYDVTISVNGKSITFSCNADIYSSIDLIINEELEYLGRGGR